MLWGAEAEAFKRFKCPFCQAEPGHYCRTVRPTWYAPGRPYKGTVHLDRLAREHKRRRVEASIMDAWDGAMSSFQIQVEIIRAREYLTGGQINAAVKEALGDMAPPPAKPKTKSA